MDTLIKFRALCETCEAAEASVWCKTEARPMCATCNKQTHLSSTRHEVESLVRSSVLSPLCERCVDVPALVYCRVHGMCVCEMCMVDIAKSGQSDMEGYRDSGGEQGRSVNENKLGGYQSPACWEDEDARVRLRDSQVGQSFAFDKMDFTSFYRTPIITGLCTGEALKQLNDAQTSSQGKVRNWLAASDAIASSAPSAASNPPLDLSYFKTSVPF